MKDLKEVYKQIGCLALRELRQKKLASGLPFMINSSKLPLGQCYFEFPDGSFQLVTICKKSNDFKVVKKLSRKEESSLRKLLLPIS